MKKQQKQLVLMIVMLFLIGAGYWGLLSYNKSQSNKVEENTIPLIENVEASDITEFSYLYDGVTCHFVKENDTWKAMEDKELILNQTRIENMVSKAIHVQMVSQIDEVQALEDYGLEEPGNIITFVAGGNTYKITIGAKNAITDYYYVTLNDSNIVYLIESTDVTGFHYSVEDLVEEPEETETPAGTEE